MFWPPCSRGNLASPRGHCCPCSFCKGLLFLTTANQRPSETRPSGPSQPPLSGPVVSTEPHEEEFSSDLLRGACAHPLHHVLTPPSSDPSFSALLGRAPFQVVNSLLCPCPQVTECGVRKTQHPL